MEDIDNISNMEEVEPKKLRCGAVMNKMSQIMQLITADGKEEFTFLLILHRIMAEGCDLGSKDERASLTFQFDGQNSGKIRKTGRPEIMKGLVLPIKILKKWQARTQGFSKSGILTN